MKYKVGDSVVIRKDLEICKTYGIYGFALSMKEHLGKTTQITEVCSNYYLIDCDNYRLAWSDEMIDHEATSLLNSKPTKTKKKLVPFDFSKMEKDFSNVIYRNGERPQFVCKGTNSILPITSVDFYGDAELHDLNGAANVTGFQDPLDLLLEVEREPKTYTEEEVKELLDWYANETSRITGIIKQDGADKIIENFENRKQ